MVTRLGIRMNPWVFLTSAAIILLFVAVGAAAPDWLKMVFDDVQGFIVEKLGWFYLFSVSGFLIFVLWLAAGRYGRVRLGKDDERPRYSYLTWFSMLFSAGMGIGLLFYSVAEPVLHFANPPSTTVSSAQAARLAMETTFFHWGLHAWGIYTLMGLALAYASYRLGLPLTLRSPFRPLLGARIDGWAGNAIDILGIVGTMFGVSTSLGLGVLQINEGLDRVGVLDQSLVHQVFLIGGITLIATASVVSGVDRGIRRLSELNMALGLLLLGFVLIAGPTTFLVLGLSENLGDYLQHLVGRSFSTLAYRGEVGMRWEASWTLFYWGWWIAWSPFVGMFIARVSRGRTIREFVLGVLLVPSLFAMIWLSVFGNTALHIELFGQGGIVTAVGKSMPSALYATLEALPWSTVTSAVATIVIVTYFVTSSDSASMVIDILAAGGNPDPPIPQRIFWALTEGGVAAVLLVVSGKGGLKALQTTAIACALPLTALLIVLCFSLKRALKAEGRYQSGAQYQAAE